MGDWSLEERTCLVTGATSGIGQETALGLAREGARVLIVDRDEASARETQAQVESEGGLSAVAIADVSRLDACRVMTDTCLERFGRIDVLHNNVGIGAGDSGPVHLGEEDWDRIHSVNLKSMFLTCKCVLPVMRRQGCGVILNVSSISSICSVGTVSYTHLTLPTNSRV